MGERVRRGNTRITGKEQFYTPSSVAAHVVDLIVTRYPEAPDRIWVEPCGGTGTFLDAFEAVGVTRMWSGDIEPHDPRVKLEDFLAGGPSDDEVAGAVVATNPPFGRNNSLSVPFFNRAARFASVIAFIVPRSWRKWSVIDRLNLHYHLVIDEDLHIDYETVDRQMISRAGNLQTCIQVWERREELREKHVVHDRGYVTKTDPGNADVSLTIFGRGCGTVKTDFPRVTNTTQMFLKVRDLEVLEAMCTINFSRFFNSVAYTEALSLKEINFLLNEYFDQR
jgi:hypothetical protein